jgi:nitrate reductase alpha subunit
MEEPQGNAARSDWDHYREMARQLRELARQVRFPAARQELLDLALRYEQRADRLDARSAAGSDPDHR